MKLYPNSLLILTIAPLVLAGCESPPSPPLAATSGPNPAAVTTPSPVAQPVPIKSLPEEKNPVKIETKESAIPSAGEAPPLAAPATETKPPEKPNPAARPRPKADREPTKPGDPEKITFDDLNLRMTADMVYRPFMLSDRAKELEGKRVLLNGEIYGGGTTGTEKLKEFILLRNRECKYGAGGQADHVADVKMKDGHTAKYTEGIIRVEGTLRIVPFNDAVGGNTKHIFVLEDALLK